MAVEHRKLLIIEDNIAQLKALSNYFGAKNEVYTASTIAHGIELAKSEMLDGIILDLILPDGSGMTLFDAVKELPPVVILSDISSEESMMEGFSQGALDYVVKPCSPELLEMRLSLRLLPVQKSTISVNGLTVNASKRTCTFNNKPIPLTSSEFNILLFLITHSGEYFLPDEIYENVWKMKSLHTTTIKRHISTLRIKLAEACGDVKMIRTEFGKGYCFAGE